MKKLGPCFAVEIHVAGLGEAGLTWGEDVSSIQGWEKLTSAQSTILDQVLAAHDPATPDPWQQRQAVEDKLLTANVLAAVIRRQDEIEILLQAVISKSLIAPAELPGKGVVADLPAAVRALLAERAALNGGTV